LSVRTKNTREKLGSLFKGFTKSFDESVVLKSHKDVDAWFEGEKKFLTEYNARQATVQSRKEFYNLTP
jgi:sorting nexin-5/6/32